MLKPPLKKNIVGVDMIFDKDDVPYTVIALFLSSIIFFFLSAYSPLNSMYSYSS